MSKQITPEYRLKLYRVSCLYNYLFVCSTGTLYHNVYRTMQYQAGIARNHMAQQLSKLIEQSDNRHSEPILFHKLDFYDFKCLQNNLISDLT